MTGKSNNSNTSLPQNDGNFKSIGSFTAAKRELETAIGSGRDYSPELYTLAAALAHSVINKCIDPQRVIAQERETTSNSGYNPAMVDLKNGITHDIRTLETTRTSANKAFRTVYDYDGNVKTQIADKNAHEALAKLLKEPLTDGIDLVQTAAVALLEQAAEHANGENWLDTPYTTRRLSKRVYIKAADSAAYREEVTTPIQEAFRAVRRAVQDSRATQTDPRNGYSYIEDFAGGGYSGLEMIYHRLSKYADLGGMDCNGNYTTDRQAYEAYVKYESIFEQLNLTDRQAQVIRLRMQGKGYKAIATYLGVTQNAICKTCKQVQKKAIALGFIPTKPTTDGEDK